MVRTVAKAGGRVGRAEIASRGEERVAVVIGFVLIDGGEGEARGHVGRTSGLGRRNGSFLCFGMKAFFCFSKVCLAASPLPQRGEKKRSGEENRVFPASVAAVACNSR